MLAVLGINLDRGPERWAALRTAVAAAGLPGDLVRLPAVDGRALGDAELAGRVVPHVLWSVRRRARVCDHRILNTPEAVGCYLSHVRAWEWLCSAAGAGYAVALVVEDDCRFAPALAPALRPGGALAPLLARPADWDFVLLGYADVGPAGVVRPRRAAVRHPSGAALVRPDAWHYGAHCYLVSRAGAATLARLALPAELHVDLWFAVVAALGVADGFLAPRSLAWQRHGWWGRGSIPHLHHFGVPK